MIKNTLKLLFIGLLALCYIFPTQIIYYNNLYELTGSNGQAHFGFIILIDSDLMDCKKEEIIFHEKQHLIQQKQFLFPLL